LPKRRGRLRRGVSVFEHKLVDLSKRPKTRGQCPNGPCPWAGCRYHLLLKVTKNGKLKFPFEEKEFDEIEETCALRVADRGSHTLQEVGDFFNLTRERIRQIEKTALEKLSQNILMLEWRVHVSVRTIETF
jgi:hypothetical protein